MGVERRYSGSAGLLAQRFRFISAACLRVIAQRVAHQGFSAYIELCGAIEAKQVVEVEQRAGVNRDGHEFVGFDEGATFSATSAAMRGDPSVDCWIDRLNGCDASGVAAVEAHGDVELLERFEGVGDLIEQCAQGRVRGRIKPS